MENISLKRICRKPIASADDTVLTWYCAIGMNSMVVYMRGLLFAIIFCAFSLLLAEGVTSVFIRLEFINANEHDFIHSMIMLVMLACYIAVAPIFNRGISTPKNVRPPTKGSDDLHSHMYQRRPRFRLR